MDFVPSRGPSRDSCCQVTAQSFATACPSPRVISGFFLFPNWISDYFFVGLEHSLFNWFVAFKIYWACFCFHMIPMPSTSDWWVEPVTACLPHPQVKLTNGQLHFSTLLFGCALFFLASLWAGTSSCKPRTFASCLTSHTAGRLMGLPICKYELSFLASVFWKGPQERGSPQASQKLTKQLWEISAALIMSCLL